MRQCKEDDKQAWGPYGEYDSDEASSGRSMAKSDIVDGAVTGLIESTVSAVLARSKLHACTSRVEALELAGSTTANQCLELGPSHLDRWAGIMT